MTKSKTPIEEAQAFIREIEALNSVPGMMISYDMSKERICRELLRFAEALHELRRAQDAYEFSDDKSTDYQFIILAEDELNHIVNEIEKVMR